MSTVRERAMMFAPIENGPDPDRWKYVCVVYHGGAHPFVVGTCGRDDEEWDAGRYFTDLVSAIRHAADRMQSLRDETPEHTAEVVSRNVSVPFLTEKQFREVEMEMGRPRYWLGRYKTGRDCGFDEDMCAYPTSITYPRLIRYLREQRVSFTETVETHYEPEA